MCIRDSWNTESPPGTYNPPIEIKVANAATAIVTFLVVLWSWFHSGLISSVIAAVQALKKFPVVNASIDGNDVVYHGFQDIGVAVSTERGLVVPVIKDADTKSLPEIEKAILSYSDKARNGKLSIDEMQGGTFTISNGGIFGSLLSTPILNAPQTAILGMHAIQDRPVAINGEVVIRPMMYLAMSYDHRLLDGKEAVTFLVSIKEQLESPERLLLNL